MSNLKLNVQATKRKYQLQINLKKICDVTLKFS